MSKIRVLLFGEAEKGEYCTPLQLRDVPDLLEKLGHPPEDTQGIDYAIQTLLAGQEVLFFRVHEEGFSLEDYKRGLQLLLNEGNTLQLSAICMPGMGDPSVIQALSPICQAMQILLLVSERDFYDYSTGSKY